ncbi:DNA (cytosine-5-)-methyltransferase [Mariniblastus sp.]|nr:DNA (cytosine-5-)-methyltransferase [Mariniblastus sp.]
MATSKTKQRIPVVDIFAGPGGLGEGFARFPYEQPETPRFQNRLSIEKDPRAHETLRLRSFKRQFEYGKVPAAYYKLMREFKRPVADRVEKLFHAHADNAIAADAEAMCAELGNKKFQSKVGSALSQAVSGVRDWVLLGGPPCQAYSLAGRSRNRGNLKYKPEKDHRHFLYREYLKVIGEHLPSVFVMENVKGLLSATVKNERIFEQIIKDLHEPRKRLGIKKRKPKGVKDTYRLFALENDKPQQQQLFGDSRDLDLRDFVIRMENFGIPQARHRLIIMGVRNDLGVEKLPLYLKPNSPTRAIDVLQDLPRLRSGLSKEPDHDDSWRSRLSEVTKSDWYRGLKNDRAKVKQLIRTTVAELKRQELDRGNEWVKCRRKSKYLRKWYNDSKIGGVFNHETRGHIVEDLHRYLYASCYAKVVGISPTLRDFPVELLPNHRNVQQALEGSLFGDRFRVQLAERPSTTITSHISKDGHYYIHHDPSQCRSLTVREAARLQTFPDNYFFCGPRTSQYTQVGNAVPPYLAHQIAEIVDAIFIETGVV